METFGPFLDGVVTVLATGSVAGTFGGVLILIAERVHRRKAPSPEDIRRVAELYRHYYGQHALQAVGDHMLGASFGPDGRHYAVLKQVSVELLACP